MSIDPGLEYDPVSEGERINQENVYDQVRLSIPGDTRGAWRVIMLGADKGAVVFDPKIASGFGGLEGIVRAVDRGQQVKGEALGYRLNYRDLQRYMDRTKEPKEPAVESRSGSPEPVSPGATWSEPISAKGRVSGPERPERLEPPQSMPMPEIKPGFNPFSRRAR